MIRSAAKNIGWSCVVVDPNDYPLLSEQLNESGRLSYEFRVDMSRKAFSITAQYESTIDRYLSDDDFPENLNLSYTKFQDLRYGENPQQKSSVYQDDSSYGILNSRIHQGKQLSYNNIMDGDAAVSCLTEFNDPGCVVIKHANPCGAATNDNIDDAFKRAIEADKLSAFGGIIALNRECTEFIANYLDSFFIEIIIQKTKSNFKISNFLIYVLLATICDVMPLRKINKIIAQNTLHSFNIKTVSYTHLTLPTNREV